MEREKIDHNGITKIEERHFPHLKQGVPPIIACIVAMDSEEFKYLGDLFGIKSDPSAFYDVDYFAIKRLPGLGNYHISPIDSKNKLSKNFFNCLGLIVSGVDKTSGDFISFLTHEDPTSLLNRKSRFQVDLRSQLSDIKKRSEDGTVDVLIFGGAVQNSNSDLSIYTESVNTLSGCVTEVLGFEPTVVIGPKENSSTKDDVFYDNANRRLYILRQKVGDNSTFKL